MTARLTRTVVRSTAGVVFPAALAGVAAAQHGGGHPGGTGGMGGFGWWVLVPALALLSVVLLVGYGIYALGRSPASERPETDGALSTLRSRYARGELSEEEFEERRRRLEE